MMAEIGSHVGKEPWPSLEWASWIFDRASFVLIASLVIGAGATVAMVWMGIIKEHHWDLLREAGAAKTAAVELETAKAIQHASEAQLALEQYKAPRILSDAQVAKIAEPLRAYSGQEYQVTAFWDLPESFSFARRLDDVLQSAKWKFNGAGNEGFLIGGVVGVQVWIHPEADQATKSAATALIDGLAAQQFEATLKLQNPKNPKTNLIALNVGSKH